MAKSIKVWDGSVWQDVAVAVPSLDGLATEAYVANAVSNATIDLSTISNAITLGNSSVDSFTVPGLGLQASKAHGFFTPNTVENVVPIWTDLELAQEINAKDGNVFFFPSVIDDWQINVVWDSTTPLLSAISNPNYELSGTNPYYPAITIVVLAYCDIDPYMCTNFSIDGSTADMYWQGGSAPAAGVTDSINAYTYTILNDGDGGTWVMASMTPFTWV